jgi:hypothetical protein
MIKRLFIYNKTVSLKRNYALFSVVSARDIFGEKKASDEDLDRLWRKVNVVETEIDHITQRINQMEFNMAKATFFNDNTYAIYILKKYKAVALSKAKSVVAFDNPSTIFKIINEYSDHFSIKTGTSITNDKHNILITKDEIYQILLNHRTSRLLHLQNLRGLTTFFKSSKIEKVRDSVRDYNNSLSCFDADIINKLFISDRDINTIINTF